MDRTGGGKSAGTPMLVLALKIDFWFWLDSADCGPSARQ
jgi:hypothetical protein